MNNCQLKNVIAGKRDYRWGGGGSRGLKQKTLAETIVAGYANGGQEIRGADIFGKYCGGTAVR